MVVAGGGEFSDLHEDIIKSHVLKRLDGAAIASAACCSTLLRRLSGDENLWIDICRSAWPSTAEPNLSRLISAFPDGGARAFFSQAFPVPAGDCRRDLIREPPPPPTEIVSAVDIRLRDELIFTKVHTTSAGGAWFQSMPFRIDLLEPKEFVPVRTPPPAGASAADVASQMSLSWILIDPIGRKAVNLSSHLPLSAEPHWLTGEIHARYDTILAGGDVRCSITVTCSAAAADGGETQLNDVSLELEDIDGKRLNGKDSMVIFQAAMEGKKVTGENRAAESQRRNKEYERKRRENTERKLRAESSLDTFCLLTGATIFIAFCCFFLFR